MIVGQFSTLCGSVYKGGNILFTPDGNTLASPVGNRVSMFNLAEYVFLSRTNLF